MRRSIPKIQAAIRGLGINDFDDLAIILETKKIVFKKDQWLHSSCTCSKYFKESMCSHIMALALKLELAEAPLEAKKVPLGQKPKRGRPAKAKGALTRQ